LDLPTQLVAARRWDDLAELLTGLQFLEAKVGKGKAFELAEDFSQVNNAIPQVHPQAPLLRLLEEALRTDIHFIAQHPNTFFQCLWNRCWWYDSPEAAKYFDAPTAEGAAEGPPWERPGPKLWALMESWRRRKEEMTPGFLWIRSLRPPSFPLGARQRVVIRGEWNLKGIGFSPDGQRIIAWLRRVPNIGLPADRSIRVWDLASGMELIDPREEEFPYLDPSVSPKGRQYLKHEVWGPLQLWDHATGAVLTTFSTDQKTYENLSSLAFSTDENVSCMAFSPDGRRVASGAYDEDGAVHIYIWELGSGRPLVKMNMWVDGTPDAVAYSPDGERLVSGNSSGTVQVWDASNGHPLFWLTGHEGPVNAVAFSLDGRWIVSGSNWDSTIRVWEAAEGSCLAHSKGHPDSVQEIIFSSDGRHLVTRSENEALWLWSADNGAPIACLNRSTYLVLEGGGARDSLFADGQKVVHLSTEGIKSWDLTDGNEPRLIPSQPYYWSDRIVFSPDGDHFIIHGVTGGIFSLATGACLAVLHSHKGETTCMAYSPDGNRVATGSADKTIRLWEGLNGKPLACLSGHEDLVTSVGFSPDGQRLVSGSVDKTVRTWDVITGTQLSCLRIEDPGVWKSGQSRDKGEYAIHGVRAVGFTSDGQHIVTLSRSGTPFSEIHNSRVWDERSGECLKTLRGKGSFPALCAGTPWQAVLNGPEVEIISSNTGLVVGWFPATLKSLLANSSGRSWAGSFGKHLYHFALEGGEREECSISNKQVK
jgi:WD40 repeat protein